MRVNELNTFFGSPLGRTTTYSYDQATGDLLTTQDPSGALTTYTYTAGLVRTITETDLVVP